LKEGEPIIAIERGRNDSRTYWERIRREYKQEKKTQT
jgi:hypothetical protein